MDSNRSALGFVVVMALTVMVLVPMVVSARMHYIERVRIRLADQAAQPLQEVDLPEQMRERKRNRKARRQ